MTDNFDVLKAMMDGVEAFTPVFDAAEGMKADLERRGWSPTMAETIAGQWLAQVMNMAFTQQVSGG